MPHRHHNPFDPRNPLNVAFFLTFVAGDEDEPEAIRPDDAARGCGCAVLAMVIAALCVAILLSVVK